MAGKIYKGDYGVLVRVDTKVNLTDAIAFLLKVYKPDGREVCWTPTVESPAIAGILIYTTVQGDLDTTGTYKLFAQVDFVSGRFIGEVATFRVYDLWE